MYKRIEDGELLRHLEGVNAPSGELQAVAAEVVTESFLRHRPDGRADLRERLSEAMRESKESGLLVLAGLREAGLGYRKLDGQASLQMLHPRLSNPDPAEFSSKLSAVLFRSQDPVAVLTERGTEVFEEEVLGLPEGEQNMGEWVENMEVAIQR